MDLASARQVKNCDINKEKKRKVIELQLIEKTPIVIELNIIEAEVILA